MDVREGLRSGPSGCYLSPPFPAAAMRSALAFVLFALVPAAAAQTAAPAPLPVAAGQIAGEVTDAETGAPLAGAGVVIPELGIGAVSDREGRFVIEDVPPGRHAVRAGAYTYHFSTAEVDVAGEAGAALDVALRPGAGSGCAVVHEHDESGGLHNTGGGTDG